MSVGLDVFRISAKVTTFLGLSGKLALVGIRTHLHVNQDYDDDWVVEHSPSAHGARNKNHPHITTRQ
jgi:hypothetical protein